MKHFDLRLRSRRTAIVATIAFILSIVIGFDAHAAGPNLLPNSTFAQADPTDATLPLNWHRGGWGNNQPTYTYPVQGVNDAFAVRVAITSRTNGDAKWYTDPVAVTAGDSYLFSDRYQASVPTFVTAEYRLNSGAIQYQDLLTLAATTGTWAEVRVNITIPANTASVTIYHLLNQVGSLTFDAPSLTKNDPIVPPPPDPGNFIVNGSLETPSAADASIPQGWIKGGWGTNQATFTYPVAGNTSTRAAAITISSYTNGDAKWSFTPIATTSMQTLVYTDSYKATVPTFLTADYLMNDGSHRYVDLASLPAAASWGQAQATFTLPTGIQSVTVFHILNRAGTLTIDTARLAIPGPTPPPDPTNLIVNGNLHQASPMDPHTPVAWTKGGWGTNQGTFTYPVAGVNGTNGIQVALTSYTNGDAKWVFDAVPVTAGLIYRYSEFYKATVPSFITVRYDFPDGSSSYSDLLHPGVTSTWAALHVDVSPPTGARSMTIFHLIKQVGTLTASGFLLPQPSSSSTSKFSEGMVSFSFDDGYLSGYDVARPILNQAGIKGTFYLVNDYLDGTDEFYMNTAQALALNNDGHEIGGHTRTHPFLTQITQAERNDEIIAARQDEIAMGFTPMETFAYPYGEYNDAVIQTLRNAGYIGARSVNSGFNDKLSNPFLLMDQHIESSTTLLQVQAWVEQAKANKTWLVLELHQQDYSNDQYSNTPENFQAIVNYIKSSGIKTVTMREGVRLMQP